MFRVRVSLIFKLKLPQKPGAGYIVWYLINSFAFIHACSARLSENTRALRNKSAIFMRRLPKGCFHTLFSPSVAVVKLMPLSSPSVAVVILMLLIPQILFSSIFSPCVEQHRLFNSVLGVVDVAINCIFLVANVLLVQNELNQWITVIPVCYFRK